MKLRPRILVVDDIAEYLNALERALSDVCDVNIAQSSDEAKTKMSESVSMLLVDICLDESKAGVDQSGIEILKWAKAKYPGIPVVMMSAYRDFDAAVECLNLGAAKFLKKPIDICELKAVVKSLTKQD